MIYVICTFQTKGERMGWLLQVLQRSWSSPATLSCDQWLAWSVRGSIADPSSPHSTDTEGMRGPGVFHRSDILYYASHLLSSTSSTVTAKSDLVTSEYDLLPLHVTLGSIDRQLGTVAGFAQHLWKHAGVFMSEKFSIRCVKIFLYFYLLHPFIWPCFILVS